LDGDNSTLHVINEERCLARVSYTTRHGSGQFDTLLSDVMTSKSQRQFLAPVLRTQEAWDNLFLDL
jgi:hypothetical protein